MRTLITYLFIFSFCLPFYGQDSLSMEVSIPPIDLDSLVLTAPEDLNVQLERNGALALEWTADTSMIQSFEVFVANKKDANFIPFSKEPILDTRYADYLKQGKQVLNYYFKVRGIINDTLKTQFSKPVLIQTYDVVPPEVPTFTSVDVLAKGILIQWDEVGDDVDSIQIYRKKSEFEQPKMIGVANPNKGLYTDISAELGSWYYYSLFAVDASGNVSKESNSIKAYAEDMRPKDGAYNIRGEVTAFGEIKLMWDVKNSTAYKFEIYKSVNGRGLELYQKILAGKNVFFDAQVKKKKTYSYQIRTIYSDGTFSQLSEVVVVEVNP